MDLAEDVSVKAWHSRVGVSWKASFMVFRRFNNEVLSKDEVFGAMSPSQLVEWQTNARGRQAYRIKSLAQQWINGQHLTVKTKQRRLSDISSLFLHNHAPLPADPSFHFSSEVPPVEGELNVDDFRRILLNCDKMYRAVFLLMAQGLIGEGELVYINVESCNLILESLTKNVGVFKVTLPGRKQNRNIKNFYTMLSTKSDWADSMRDYLKSLPSLPKDALFLNDRSRPLTRQNIQNYFHWHAVEAGVVKQFSPLCNRCGAETVRSRRLHESGIRKIVYTCKECGEVHWAADLPNNFTNIRYGVNPHEIRDLMRSRWHLSGADPFVAEFMMEHDRQIDPNRYNKFWKYEPWYPPQEYRKALTWLNIVSEEPEKIERSALDSELESYRAESDVLRKEVSKLKQDVVQLGKVANDPLVQQVANVMQVEGGRQFFERLLKKMDRETEEWLKKAK